MKGVLKNTKAGWFVWYQVARDVITYGYDSIPLHPDSQTWMDGYNLYEGKEVEFELVMDKPEHRYSETPYAKTIDEDVFHQGLSADQIIDNHLNLVGLTNFDVYSNRDAVKEAMIMFATQETGRKIIDKEEITVTIYNMIYEQDTTNKKSCLSLSEELYDFIEKLLNESNNGK